MLAVSRFNRTKDIDLGKVRTGEGPLAHKYLMLAPVEAICLPNCREPAGTIADQSGESAQAAVANETTLDDGAKNAWIDITAA